jgi:hypothetical protein
MRQSADQKQQVLAEMTFPIDLVPYLESGFDEGWWFLGEPVNKPLNADNLGRGLL